MQTTKQNTMQITINSIKTYVTADISLHQLLLSRSINPTGLAIAINNTVIIKRLWSEYQLQHDDAVQLFQIVTGG